MTDDLNGLPYEFAVVPIKHLVIDAYQRPLTTFVEKIEHHFDPIMVGTLVLSKRSQTKYAVVDGQTRAEGMKRRGLSHVPAIVLEGLSREGEANLFSRLQRERRGMHSAARFKADVIGGDEQAVDLNKAIEDAGFFIDQNMAVGDTAISAPAALEFVYHGCNKGKKAQAVQMPELVADVLDVIRGSWPKLPKGARSAVIIKGVGQFLMDNENVDYDRLKDRLSRVQPSELGRRADLLREGAGVSGNSPKYMAEAIASQYKRRGN